MNSQEFDRWMEDFRARFPATATWLVGLPSPVETLLTWADVLKNAQLDCALQASREIQEGMWDLGQWQEIPTTIARIAYAIECERRSAETARDEPNLRDYRIKCLICRDSGLVDCWHPQTQAMARARLLRNVQTPLKWYRCVTACNCSAGDRWAEPRRKKGRRDDEKQSLPRFDERSYLPLSGNFDADKSALWKWAENHRPTQRYDFGEYAHV
jgi:hypothetical protein